jgi:O-antigen/teichoic acid export membrane protein
MQFEKTIMERVVGRAKSWLPKGGFLRSTMLLSGTTLLIQVVGLCLAPVYARLYAPADYGVFGQFYSILSALLIVAGFGFELAIPTANELDDALSLAVVSLGCVGIATLVSLSWALAVIWRVIPGAVPEHKFYLLLLPLGVLLAGLYRIAQYWAIRTQALKAIARTLIKQMIGGQTVNLSFALLYPTPLGLILAQIVSSSAGVGSLPYATNLVSLLKTHRETVFKARNLWRIAKQYRQYPLIQCPSTMLNSIGLYLPGMLMLPYFGAGFAGQFNMAQRLCRIPLVLVGSSVSQVFFSEAASVARNDPQKLRSLFNSISHKLGLSALVVLIGCSVAPWVIPVIFGQRWYEAGEIILWLGFCLALQLWVSPLSNIPNILGKLRGQLIIDATRAVFVFAALHLPHRFGWGGRVAVLCYSLVLIINYIACYVLYRHQLKAHSRQTEPKTLVAPGAVAV